MLAEHERYQGGCDSNEPEEERSINARQHAEHSEITTSETIFVTLQAGKNRESYSCDDRVDAGLRLHDEAECKIVIAKSLGAQKCADHELVDPEIEIVDASFTHLVHAETDKPPEIHGLNSPAGPP